MAATSVPIAPARNRAERRKTHHADPLPESRLAEKRAAREAFVPECHVEPLPASRTDPTVRFELPDSPVAGPEPGPEPPRWAVCPHMAKVAVRPGSTIHACACGMVFLLFGSLFLTIAPVAVDLLVQDILFGARFHNIAQAAAATQALKDQVEARTKLFLPGG